MKERETSLGGNALVDRRERERDKKGAFTPEYAMFA